MKNKFKLFGLIAIIMIAAFSFVSCELEKDEEPEDIILTVTNGTGFQGVSLYVALSSASSYGTERLGTGQVLNNNASKAITVTAGTYDILLATMNYDMYQMKNVNITSSMTVTFTATHFYQNINESDIEDLYGSWISDTNEYFSINISDGYFYFVSSSPWGGMSYGFEIISYEGTTMVCEDYGEPISFQVYINSDGKLVIDGYGSEDGTYTNENDYVGFTPPDTATTLMENYWQRDSISESPNWFTFEVEEGEEYKIFINDMDFINSDIEITDVAFDIYLNGEKLNHNKVDLLPDGGDSYFELYPEEDGTVFIKVYEIGEKGWGKFDIGYLTTGGRSNLIWQLYEDSWIAGNFEYSSKAGYIFEVNATDTYHIWIDDYNLTDSKVDVVVSAYHSVNVDGTFLPLQLNNGTENFEEKDNLNNFTFHGTKGWIVILITPKDSSSKDGNNFEIVFNTSGINPGKG